MSNNFSNLCVKLRIKRLITMIILLINILSIYSSVQNHPEKFRRNLQFTSNSVYYLKPYPKNNITGTGDLMEDSAYKALCKILSCESGCCIGNIESISCGEKAQCSVYTDYMIARVVAPAVIVPVFVILFVTLMILVFMKRNKYSFFKSFFLAALCLFIITIPCVLYYARKRAKDSEIKVSIQNQMEEEGKAKSDDKNKVRFDSSLERDDILVINKLEEKKASSKSSPNKNNEALNEYRKIINEMDENQEQENEEEFNMRQEVQIIQENNNDVDENSHNNQSIRSEAMEIEGHALTDPMQKKRHSENLNSEDNGLIDDKEEENKQDENEEENKENIENQEENKEGLANEEKEINPEQGEENKESPSEEMKQEASAEVKMEDYQKEAEKVRLSDSLQRIKQLPLLKTPEDAARRSELFDRFDPNGNLYLSLGEVDKGVREILSLSEKFLKKDVIKRAFHAAKNTGAKRSKLSDDYIEKNEFRTFLVYLRQYSEYYEMFDIIDVVDDKKVSLDEFKAAIPIMNKWGIEIHEAEEAFDSIDTNKGGQILFDEFADWAIFKNLDLENDDDFNDEDLAKLAR